MAHNSHDPINSLHPPPLNLHFHCRFVICSENIQGFVLTKCSSLEKYLLLRSTLELLLCYDMNDQIGVSKQHIWLGSMVSSRGINNLRLPLHFPSLACSHLSVLQSTQGSGRPPLLLRMNQ